MHGEAHENENDGTLTAVATTRNSPMKTTKININAAAKS